MYSTLVAAIQTGVVSVDSSHSHRHGMAVSQPRVKQAVLLFKLVHPACRSRSITPACM